MSEEIATEEVLTPKAVPSLPGPHLVVGVDGSDPSIAALLWAVRYGALIDAPVEAVISWGYPTTYGLGGVPSNWSPEVDARQVLAKAVATVAAIVPAGQASRVTQLVREGYAAQVLLDESKDAQLLIVGSRGHGGFAGLLLGSVSANCAEHAQCPVLIIHGKATS